MPLLVVKKTFVEIEESPSTECDEERRIRTAPAAIYPFFEDESTDCDSDVGDGDVVAIASTSTSDEVPLVDVGSATNSVPSSLRSLPLEPPSFVVKNTFIHIEDSENDNYRRVRSGPATIVDADSRARKILDTIIDVESGFDSESPALGIATGYQEKPVAPLGTGNSVAEALAAKAAKLAERQLKHDRRECKPCAYFAFKSDGCRMGDDCEHCHLCDKRDSRRREKERAKELKKAQRQNRPRHMA